MGVHSGLLGICRFYIRYLGVEYGAVFRVTGAIRGLLRVLGFRVVIGHRDLDVSVYGSGSKFRVAGLWVIVQSSLP